MIAIIAIISNVTYLRTDEVFHLTRILEFYEASRNSIIGMQTKAGSTKPQEQYTYIVRMSVLQDVEYAPENRIYEAPLIIIFLTAYTLRYEQS